MCKTQRESGGRTGQLAELLEFARERYDPDRLRLYILEWNKRSRKVAASHGFAVESVLATDEGPFLVMVRRPRG